MIVSWKWLQEYVAAGAAVEEFARRMMLAGFNHESTEPVGDDWAVDLEITSNRPDCLGQIGLAREAAVLFEKQLKLPAARPAAGKTDVASLTKVTLAAPQACPRYLARVICGVRVGPSPAWLVERLQTLGIAAINNLVDITNYVLMECGQPLHAFDYQKLAGKEIVVRHAKPGETLMAIDHQTYKLDPAMCVIADRDNPVAIAGVMGGAATEITAATVDVLIEAAEFDPLSVRTTSRKLALRSDSSYRFERGLDPEGVDWASRRCCELILQLAGGELASGAIDVGRQSPPHIAVVLRWNQIERVLGIAISPEAARRVLTALGLKELTITPEQGEFSIPSWRRDLTREIDLIEEIARVTGYDAIPEDRAVPQVPSSRTRRDRVVAKLRTALVCAGFDEALTLSAVEEEASAAFSPWCAAEPLRASMPVLRRADRLRRSLLPSLLTARRINETFSNPQADLFETAKVYWPREAGLPHEEPMLALCGGGDFFALKGILETLLAALEPMAELTVKPFANPLFAAGRGAELYLGDEHVGYLGEVGKAGLAKFELRHAVTVAEIKIAALDAAAELIPQAVELSPFPPVERDLNLVVAEEVRWAELEQTVLANAGPLLERLDYRDTWRDADKLGPGKKSLLFSLLLRGQSATLTGGDADQVRDAVVRACGIKHGAELRT